MAAPAAITAAGTRTPLAWNLRSRRFVGRRRRLVGRSVPPAALAARVVAVLLPRRELVDVEGEPHDQLAGVGLIGRLAVVPRDALDLRGAARIGLLVLGVV